MTKKQKIIAIIISIGATLLLVPLVVEIALFAAFGFGHGILYFVSLYWKNKSRPNYGFFAPSTYQLSIEDKDFTLMEGLHLKSAIFEFVSESEKEEQTIIFQKGDGDDKYFLNITYSLLDDASTEIQYSVSFSKCSIGTNGRYTNLHAYYIDSTVSATFDENALVSTLKIQLEPLADRRINTSIYCDTQSYTKILLPEGDNL